MSPEPSRVHGYISLIDLATDEKHWPLDTAVPIYTFIDLIDVVFRARDGSTVTTNLVPANWSDWYFKYESDSTGTRRLAYHYDIQLEQVPGHPGLPYLQLGPAPQYLVKIIYDPEQYQFQTVEVESGYITSPHGTQTRPNGTRYDPFTLRRRDILFPNWQ